MNDFRVKYLATYYGPSYGSWGPPESMDAFPSIEAAERSFRSRVHAGWDYSCVFRRNQDDMWGYDEFTSTSFPATTNQDVMDLYPVIGDGRFGTLQVDDIPSLRLTVGPRGGVVREDY